MCVRLFHLAFYVPKAHAAAVKTAIFLAGAGKLGSYDCCSWETPGQGQFRPLAGAKPFLGKLDKLEKVAEIKVETICREDVMLAVLRALKQAHPYEEVAYMVFPMLSEEVFVAANSAK